MTAKVIPFPAPQPRFDAREVARILWDWERERKALEDSTAEGRSSRAGSVGPRQEVKA